MNEIYQTVAKQREYFNSGKLSEVKSRKQELTKLYEKIKEREQDIAAALRADLNKSDFEGYASEIGLVYSEIKFMLANMKKILKPKRLRVAITQLPAKGRIYHEPLGVVLIISPWNYPVLLSLMPLIGAIASGNSVVLKPSNYSINVTKILVEIFKDFDSVSVIEGDRYVNQSLLDCKFDHIFFTGSEQVGKTVMTKAAENLTPVTLELGGKSPCIVDISADIDKSAKRIVWGKLLNSGQTCVAPDYIIAHSAIKDELVVAMQKYVKIFYGENPERNRDYPKIISQKHYDRLTSIINNSDNVIGGSKNDEDRKIALAIVNSASWDSPCMSEELFGPIMPIIEFFDIAEVIAKINSRPKPLALYLFAKSRKIQNLIVSNISYGGGCINDTVVHLASSHMPFGGVGASGIGSYHGAKSIETLSHSKSVLKKSFAFEVPIRYSPNANKLKLLKKLIK